VEINALQSTTVVNCKYINVHMRQLPSIRHSLTTEAMLTLRLLSAVDLITATVCSLLYVVIQNAAARFVTGARRRDHVTPVLRELHWLPCDKESGLKQLSWYTSAFTAWLHYTWHHTANQHHHALVGTVCDPPRLANSTFLARRLTIREAKFRYQWTSCLEQLTCCTSVT